MKKIIACLLAVMMLITVLSGCLGATPENPSAQQDAPDTNSGDNTAPVAAPEDAVYEMRVIGSQGGDERATLLEDAAEMLREKWPGFTMVNESTQDYAQKIRLAFSAGEGHEILYLDDLNQQVLMQGNHIMEISSYIQERGWIDKSTIGAVEFNNLRTPGELYSVPFLMAPILVYYNKDIFADIGATDIPKTVDELEDILIKARDAGYVSMESNGVDMYNKLWMIFNLVQNTASKAEIDDWYYNISSSDGMRDAFIQFYELMIKWEEAGYFRDDYLGIDYDGATALFSQGNTAMIVSGDWDLPLFEMSGLNLGCFAFPPPTPTDNPYIVNAVDGAWALNANLNATQREIVLDWIDIFFDIDYVIKWYEAGFTPTVKGDYSSADVSALKLESVAAIEPTRMGFYLDNVKPGYLDFMVTHTQRLFLREIDTAELWENLYEEWSRAD